MEKLQSRNIYNPQEFQMEFSNIFYRLGRAGA